MKKKLILLFLLVSVFTFNAISQCKIVIQSPTGDLKGYVEGGNIFYDGSSDRVLDFSATDSIKDAEGGVLALFDPVTGNVTDQNNDLIMTVEPDGDLLDLLGNPIGHVDEGVLYDSDEYPLVTIEGVNALFVAYYYYFYFTGF